MSPAVQASQTSPGALDQSLLLEGIPGIDIQIVGKDPLECSAPSTLGGSVASALTVPAASLAFWGRGSSNHRARHVPGTGLGITLLNSHRSAPVSVAGVSLIPVAISLLHSALTLSSSFSGGTVRGAGPRMLWGCG